MPTILSFQTIFVVAINDFYHVNNKPINLTKKCNHKDFKVLLQKSVNKIFIKLTINNYYDYYSENIKYFVKLTKFLLSIFITKHNTFLIKHLP